MPELSRRHGISENTIYRWKSNSGGLKVSEAKRLRELDRLSTTAAEDDRLPQWSPLTCKGVFFSAKRLGVKLHFIHRGKPTQNNFIESFNGKFRAYCLDLQWFISIEDPRLTIQR